MIFEFHDAEKVGSANGLFYDEVRRANLQLHFCCNGDFASIFHDGMRPTDIPEVAPVTSSK